MTVPWPGRSRSTDPALSGTILLLRPGALGDALLAVPTLRALRRRFPTHRLHLASHPAASRFLAGVGETDEWSSFDAPEHAWLFSEVERPTRVPSLIAAWLADANGSMRRRLETLVGEGNAVVAPSRPQVGNATHCATHLLASVAAWTGDCAPDTRPLNIVPCASSEVLLHPGSGSQTKNWPSEHFATVARALVDHGLSVRLIVGEADQQPAAEVERALGDTLPRLTSPDLSELASRLAGCRVYVGNDSGVSHLAGLSGARTTVLFAPTSPETWRPLGPGVTVLDFGTPPAHVVRAVVEAASD